MVPSEGDAALISVMTALVLQFWIACFRLVGVWFLGGMFL
jgi:type IV secretory pathway TrbD component